MRHSNPKYDDLRDPGKHFGEDEPVFFVRARDLAAPKALRAWARETKKLGGSEALAVSALEWAREMEKWARLHGGRVAD